MLKGFGRRLAVEAHGADALKEVLSAAAGRWQGYWLDNLARVHARFTARAVYNRASACKDAAAGTSFRRDTLVDVDAANPPHTLPLPETAAARASRLTAAAAFAP